LDHALAVELLGQSLDEEQCWFPMVVAIRKDHDGGRKTRRAEKIAIAFPTPA
jgi:hypothetical protein